MFKKERLQYRCFIESVGFVEDDYDFAYNRPHYPKYNMREDYPYNNDVYNSRDIYITEYPHFIGSHFYNRKRLPYNNKHTNRNVEYYNDYNNPNYDSNRRGYPQKNKGYFVKQKTNNKPLNYYSDRTNNSKDFNNQSREFTRPIDNNERYVKEKPIKNNYVSFLQNNSNSSYQPSFLSSNYKQNVVNPMYVKVDKTTPALERIFNDNSNRR